VGGGGGLSATSLKVSDCQPKTPIGSSTNDAELRTASHMTFFVVWLIGKRVHWEKG